MYVFALSGKTLTGSILLILFPQVMQKQTISAVENWTAIWSPVVSEILLSKIINNRKCLGSFFLDRV